MTIANVVGVVVGVVLLITGIARLVFLPVECSSHRMEPGQVCTGTEKGHAVTRTFEQQRALRDATDGFLIIGGLAVAAGSTVLLRRGLRS